MCYQGLIRVIQIDVFMPVTWCKVDFIRVSSFLKSDCKLKLSSEYNRTQYKFKLLDVILNHHTSNASRKKKLKLKFVPLMVRNIYQVIFLQLNVSEVRQI